MVQNDFRPKKIWVNKKACFPRNFWFRTILGSEKSWFKNSYVNEKCSNRKNRVKKNVS